MSHGLDQWDRQIITILQKDGRASNIEIARKLSLAEATVRRRMERLLESGAISVVAVANPEHLGFVSRMIIAVQTDVTQLEATAQRLAELPEVYSVNIVAGTYDIIIEVALPSSGELLSFILDGVVAIPGVRRTDTYHVLKAVKRFCDWVIPDEPTTVRGQPSKSPIQPSTNVVPGAIIVPS